MKRQFKLQCMVLCGVSLSLMLLGELPARAEDEDPIRDVGRGRVTEPASPVDDVALQAEELQRKPGEIVGGEPLGRTVVMGMYLREEPDSELPVVVEVAPATPAFDAGIRPGDEIISFDGFTADTYRKWVDGFRKLAGDVPEGRSVPVEVLREGEVLSLRLRKPEAAGPVPSRPTPPPLTQQHFEQTQQPAAILPRATQPVRSGDSLLASGFFGQPFADVMGTVGDRAVAEIFHLDSRQRPQVPGVGLPPAATQPPPVTPSPESTQPPATTPPPASTLPATATQPPSAALPRPADRDLEAATDGTTADRLGARIGLAGFRDQQTGMLVMLDVGGLEPGNYLVGIDDVSVILSGAQRGAVQQPGVPAQPPQQQRQLPPPQLGEPPERPPVVPLPEDAAPPADRQPDAGQPGAGQPGVDQPAARGAEPQSRIQPRGQQAAILAQVIDQPAEPEQPLDRLPDQQIEPTGAPPADRAEQLDTPPTGPAPPVDATQPGREPAPPVLDPGTTGIGPTIPIGVLVVDASGTGTLQQVVEGVQVRQVVGQAIALYTQAAAPDAPAPESVHPGAQPAETDPTGDRAPAGVIQPAPGQQPLQPAPGRQQIPGQQRPIPAAGQPLGHGHIPVAAGVIRLISDRLPAAAGAAEQQPATERRIDRAERPGPAAPAPTEETLR